MLITTCLLAISLPLAFAFPKTYLVSTRLIYNLEDPSGQQVLISFKRSNASNEHCANYQSSSLLLNNTELYSKMNLLASALKSSVLLISIRRPQLASILTGLFNLVYHFALSLKSEDRKIGLDFLDNIFSVIFGRDNRLALMQYLNHQIQFNNSAFGHDIVNNSQYHSWKFVETVQNIGLALSSLSSSNNYSGCIAAVEAVTKIDRISNSIGKRLNLGPNGLFLNLLILETYVAEHVFKSRALKNSVSLLITRLASILESNANSPLIRQILKYIEFYFMIDNVMKLKYINIYLKPCIANLLEDYSIDFSYAIRDAFDCSIVKKKKHAVGLILQVAPAEMFTEQNRRVILARFINSGKCKAVSFLFKVDEFRFEGDQLFALKLSCAGKPQFKIFKKLLKQLVLTSELILELLSYTAENDFADAFYHLALTFWDELEKADFNQVFIKAEQNSSWKVVKLFVKKPKTLRLDSNLRRRAKKLRNNNHRHK